MVTVAWGGGEAGEEGSKWNGCSWWVAVVGEEASEPA